MKHRVLVLVSFLAVATALAKYVRPTVVTEMVLNGRAFLASLSPEQQKKATFSTQDEERMNWHYIPRPRKGVSLGELSPAQRKLAHAFLASGLSPEGYIRATQIMFLEELLYEVERDRARRDPDGYFFSVFGEPSPNGVWGWRVEGHHLSLNFTARDGQVISATPSFWGANPAVAKQGSQTGLRVLATEELLARELLHSLKGDKRQQVLISTEAPRDILTRADPVAKMGAPEGVAMKSMTRDQAEALTELLRVYVFRLRAELADKEWKKIQQAGLENVHFAWAGGLEPGEGHYYRIQGADFVIEYDNTQNEANHIHTVWRDFKNDFGRDLLRDHYSQSHKH